jgi:hypothetical protein
MKTIAIELKNYNRRADRTVSLRADSLVELGSKDIAEIDGHIGDVGFVVLTDAHNLDNIKVDEILEGLPENDLYDNHKTPSQRLRNVLYVRLEQKLGRKPEKEEFATYYKNQMEGLINKFKEDLE